MCWPICATMLRQNCDLPAILQALVAPSAAQAVSNTLLRDDADPVKLVFEGIGTGFFCMQLKQAAANDQLAANPPLIRQYR